MKITRTLLLGLALMISPFISRSAEANETLILILGDSLTEGYGINKKDAYPSLVENLLQKDGYKVKVLNAGISGSTSASAASRLKWFIQKKPDVLFLALGANDGLRGVDIPTTKKNLKETIHLAKKSNIQVWLAGMYMPPNYGLKYTKDFARMYKELASEEKTPFLPFLLDGVAGKAKFNQPDAIHPNEEGHRVIANNVAKFFKENLKK